jgi:hypothetical protein
MNIVIIIILLANIFLTVFRYVFQDTINEQSKQILFYTHLALNILTMFYFIYKAMYSSNSFITNNAGLEGRQTPETALNKASNGFDIASLLESIQSGNFDTSSLTNLVSSIIQSNPNILKNLI